MSLPYVILTLCSTDNELELELVENFPSEKISTRNVYKTNPEKKKSDFFKEIPLLIGKSKHIILLHLVQPDLPYFSNRPQGFYL